MVALSFVCSWLCLLFSYYVMVFVALKGRKECLTLKFLFRDNINIVAYLTFNHNKSFIQGGIDFILKGCIVFRVIHWFSCMIGLLLLKFLSEFLLSYCWQLGESFYMSNASYLFYLPIFWVSKIFIFVCCYYEWGGHKV